MNSLKGKQADNLMKVLNKVEMSCGECPLKEPCDFWEKENKDKNKRKITICGTLNLILKEGIENE